MIYDPNETYEDTLEKLRSARNKAIARGKRPDSIERAWRRYYETKEKLDKEYEDAIRRLER